jgi:hypothetical protein
MMSNKSLQATLRFCHVLDDFWPAVAQLLS